MSTSSQKTDKDLTFIELGHTTYFQSKAFKFSCTFSNDPFDNCQIFTLGGFGNVIDRVKVKAAFQEILDTVFEYAGKNTLLIDVYWGHFKKLTDLLYNSKYTVLSFHQYVNTDTNNDMVLVRIASTKWTK